MYSNYLENIEEFYQGYLWRDDWRRIWDSHQGHCRAVQENGSSDTKAKNNALSCFGVFPVKACSTTNDGQMYHRADSACCYTGHRFLARGHRRWNSSWCRNHNLCWACWIFSDKIVAHCSPMASGRFENILPGGKTALPAKRRSWCFHQGFRRWHKNSENSPLFRQFQWLNPFQSTPTMRPIQRHGKNLNFNPETPKLLQMFPGSPLVLHLFQIHGTFNCETDLIYWI